jgi:tRNA(adenine34) deaminase
MTSRLKSAISMNDEKFMNEALREARKALKINEVPIGCVIVKNGRVIGRGHNRTIRANDPTAHAEIIAIRKAARATGNYRLTNCDLYVTIEPCVMCAGAIIWARLRRVVFGAWEAKAGACGSVVNIVDNRSFNHRAKCTGGVMESDCLCLIKDFFKTRRGICPKRCLEEI